MYRLCDGRARSMLVLRPVSTLALIALSLAMASQASAGLINSTYSLKLTGPVAEGASMSTEQYAATGILFNAAGFANVPNTISPTPVPPFEATTNRVNRVVEPTPLSDTIPSTATIWIQGPPLDPFNAFANDLDLTKLVELELILNWGALPLGEKIVVSDFNLDKGIPFAPVSVQYSGLGTPASPLTILAKFNPADVNRAGGNFVKVQFDFDRMVIPEPATLTLLALTSLGLVGLYGRRRNG